MSVPNFSGSLFYIFLLYLVYRSEHKKTILVLVAIAILITLSDQLSVHAFKNVFQRLRPCHNPDIMLQVHTVEKCGGQFGFVSSHAMNSFSLAFFITGLLRSKFQWISWVMFALGTTHQSTPGFTWVCIILAM